MFCFPSSTFVYFHLRCGFVPLGFKLWFNRKQQTAYQVGISVRGTYNSFVACSPKGALSLHNFYLGENKIQPYECMYLLYFHFLLYYYLRITYHPICGHDISKFIVRIQTIILCDLFCFRIQALPSPNRCCKSLKSSLLLQTEMPAP